MPLGEGGIFQPSAAKWNILGTNDASFNDGTGIFGLKKDLLTTDSNPYKFSAYRNSAQSPADGAIVIFDTENYDTNSNYNTSDGKYTAPVSGFYLFNVNITYSINGNNGVAFGARLYKNGSEIAITSFVNTYTGAYSPSLSLTRLVQLTAGDYVTGNAASGGQAVVTGAAKTYFSGFLVSRT